MRHSLHGWLAPISVLRKAFGQPGGKRRAHRKRSTLPTIEALEDRAVPALWTVTTLADNPVNANGSVRSLPFIPWTGETNTSPTGSGAIFARYLNPRNTTVIGSPGGPPHRTAAA